MEVYHFNVDGKNGDDDDGSIMDVIEAYVQGNKKSETAPRTANASFDVRFSFPSVKVDLFIRFRDTKR